MALEIERYSAEQAAALVLEGKVLRLPAGLARRRAARLERFEEGVREKRVVVTRASVPLGRRYIGNPRNDLDRGALAAVCHFRANVPRRSRLPRPRRCRGGR